MKRLIADWIWRAAVLAALAWIGWQLQLMHQDMMQPEDSTTTASAAPDGRNPDVQDSIEDLRDDVAALDQKVDALMIATAQLKK